MNLERQLIERALETEQRMMQRQALLKRLWKLDQRREGKLSGNTFDGSRAEMHAACRNDAPTILSSPTNNSAA